MVVGEEGRCRGVGTQQLPRVGTTKAKGCTRATSATAPAACRQPSTTIYATGCACCPDRQGHWEVRHRRPACQTSSCVPGHGASQWLCGALEKAGVNQLYIERLVNRQHARQLTASQFFGIETSPASAETEAWPSTSGKQTWRCSAAQGRSEAPYSCCIKTRCCSAQAQARRHS